MKLDPILIAVPVFFVCIGLELWAARRAGRALYRLNDTLANLHLGAGQVLLSAVLKAPLLGLYALVYEGATALRGGWGWWESSSALSWVIGALMMDFAYYWLHRFSHELNFMWAAHAVHHQSEEYNLSVALRQSWLQFVYAGFFYLPLAAVGLPAGPFFLLNALNTLYQFWIHTRLIGDLGPLERVLNTPSHHRVHHGVDDEYIDRNYAGVLIIWDKLFGTFEPEGRAPRYGVIKPLRTWGAGWANLDVWAQVARRAAAAPSWGERIGRGVRLLAREPAYVDPGERLSVVGGAAGVGGAGEGAVGALRTDAEYTLYDARGPLNSLAIALGGLSLLSALWVLARAPLAPSPWVLCAWVVAHVMAGVSLGGMMDGRRWAPWAEGARWGLIGGLWAWAPLA
jgi:alkylglycerol monooxygenase